MPHVYTDEERAAMDRADIRKLARLRHHPAGPHTPRCHGHIWERCQRYRLPYCGILAALVILALLPHLFACPS